MSIDQARQRQSFCCRACRASKRSMGKCVCGPPQSPCLHLAGCYFGEKHHHCESCSRKCKCANIRGDSCWGLSGNPRSKMRALGIGSPLLKMSCACLLSVEEGGATWICGSAARFGCMGRGPLLSCLLKIHAIVGSTCSARFCLASSIM